MSRDKFEAWWQDQRFYGDPMLKEQALKAWLAGRESMRDEAAAFVEFQRNNIPATGQEFAVVIRKIDL